MMGLRVTSGSTIESCSTYLTSSGNEYIRNTIGF